MVLESVVADLLNRFLGDYVENLNKSQLKLGIWGGKEPRPSPAPFPRRCGAAGVARLGRFLARRRGAGLVGCGPPREGLAGCGTAAPLRGCCVGFSAACEGRASCGAAALREGWSVSQAADLPLSTSPP